MMRLKLPPRVKVLEALGSIADGRVRVISDSEAEVLSSVGDRVYRVFIDLSSNKVFSDDNGTYYRNYVGYPVIAFLMVKGVLPYDDRLANALRGINWRKINEAFRNYFLVENYIKNLLKGKDFTDDYVDRFIDDVLTKLKSIPLYKSSM